ncbi:MAG: peptidylprolyl isomerase [Oscillospiraceae bacterium]|nr:peptidylprolyl isomerase [Oscillospiraceae bacterium]
MYKAKTKRIKKFLSALVAGTMLFALAACEEDPSVSPEAQGNTRGTSGASKSEGESKEINPDRIIGNVGGVVKLEPGDKYTVITVKDFGEIKIKLFPEVAPIAVANFINLAESGYYEGKLIHRIIPNFMLQGGSPFGDGMGDPNYKDYFSIEPSEHASHIYGALAMANAGPQYNSQQFYIVNNKNGYTGLDGGYTVFGQTLEGFDVVDAISSVKTGANDRPTKEISIESVTIHTHE